MLIISDPGAAMWGSCGLLRSIILGSWRLDSNWICTDELQRMIDGSRDLTGRICWWQKHCTKYSCASLGWRHTKVHIPYADYGQVLYPESALPSISVVRMVAHAKDGKDLPFFRVLNRRRQGRSAIEARQIQDPPPFTILSRQGQ